MRKFNISYVLALVAAVVFIGSFALPIYGAKQIDRDFFMEVGRGNVPGMSAVDKYAKNQEIDSGVTADIWTGGKTVASGGTSLLWVAPTQARIHNLASSSVSDSQYAGVGARSIVVYGLPDWSTAEVNETVLMDGASAVATANSYVIIHRMKVLTSGGDPSPSGLISATAVTDSTVTARIEIGEGQTHMSIYGIPSTQKLFIYDIGVALNKAAGAAQLVDNDLLVNEEPNSQLTAFRHIHNVGLQTVGTSGLPVPFTVPKMITGPAIVKLQATSGTNDIDLSGWFNAILVNN